MSLLKNRVSCRATSSLIIAKSPIKAKKWLLPSFSGLMPMQTRGIPRKRSMPRFRILECRYSRFNTAKLPSLHIFHLRIMARYSGEPILCGHGRMPGSSCWPEFFSVGLFCQSKMTVVDRIGMHHPVSGSSADIYRWICCSSACEI